MLTPNAALAYAVLDQIDAHPESWNQTDWVCGTAACFAGWAVRLAGGVLVGESAGAEVESGPSGLIGYGVEEAAYVALGIDEAKSGWAHGDYSGWLFSDSNTREDLGRLVAEIFGPRPGGVR